jgi:iron complex transport system ATP-binding protein
MMNSLVASGLGVTRSSRRILRDVTVDISSGSVLAVVGPNGSGKSTLLRCVAGLWPATEGSVTLDDKPLHLYPRIELARFIAYVPQDTHFDFAFTVREVVLMGRYAHRGRFDREAEQDIQAVADALSQTDLTQLGDRVVTALSGGEKRRVLIARALATRAPILLLDEPTANLDVDHTLDILELCRTLARQQYALAIATHDLNSVCQLADRVAMIDQGALVGVGGPEIILTPQNLERAFRVRSETLIGSDGTRLLHFKRLAASSGVQRT